MIEGMFFRIFQIKDSSNFYQNSTWKKIIKPNLSPHSEQGNFFTKCLQTYLRRICFYSKILNSNFLCSLSLQTLCIASKGESETWRGNFVYNSCDFQHVLHDPAKCDVNPRWSKIAILANKKICTFPRPQ